MACHPYKLCLERFQQLWSFFPETGLFTSLSGLLLVHGAVSLGWFHGSIILWFLPVFWRDANSVLARRQQIFSYPTA